MQHAHPRTIAHALAHLTPDERSAIASVIRSMNSPSTIVGLAHALGELGTLDVAGRNAVAGIVASEGDEAELAANLDREINAAVARNESARVNAMMPNGGGQ